MKLHPKCFENCFFGVNLFLIRNRLKRVLAKFRRSKNCEKMRKNREKFTKIRESLVYEEGDHFFCFCYV